MWDWARGRNSRSPWAWRWRGSMGSTSGCEIAALYDRGRRSGIGVGAFLQGGFLVDGGRGARDEPPRIVSRVEFPARWRMLLIDGTLQGLHGEQELAAFRALPVFRKAFSAQLCRLMLLQGLPALLGGDAECFGLAIGSCSA